MARGEALRLLIIGIDGADHLLTQRLMADGDLPNLCRLTRRGACGPLRSTTPPTTPPAWTSIMTGKSPGRHGVYDFLPMSGDAMETPIASRRRATTVWRALSDAGLRVGTFNLPATYPPEVLSGFQISGFDGPSYQPSLAEPREAFAVLDKAVGEYDLCPLSIQDPEGDRDALVRHADLPVIGSKALLARFPCDVYMTSFQIVDWVHHGHLGREMRPMQPESLAPDGHVREAYRLVDDRVGDLLSAAADAGTNVIILSDHGGAAADRLVNLEKLFLERGLMAYGSRSGGDAGGLEARRSRAAQALGLWMRVKQALPAVARVLGPVARRLRSRLASYQRDVQIDWSRTRAAPWGDYAQVRLNIAGRDPEGIVPPGEADALAAEVEDLILSVQDPGTGERLFAEVLRNEQLYDGPFSHLGPDLYARPAEERCVTVSARPGISTLPLSDVQPEPVVALEPPWGVHSSVGIIAMAGPSVGQRCEITDAGVEDMTPTALHMLGQPIPLDLDGRVLTEALSAELAAASPQRCAPWPPPERVTDAGYSDAEREAVERRLRHLGYMGRAQGRSVKMT
ncbi:MAG: alkaline phosphatase family protein [Armatimonadota bacterium]